MTIIQHLRWLDFLDIALVAFLIYRIVLIIKGATAFRILAGVAFLLAANLIAQYSGLATLNKILDHFISSLLLVLLIIFQSDIRRAIITLGRGRLFGSMRDTEESEVLSELVKTAETLAAKKIGALVVVERDMLVDDFLETGTEIDAKVTSELISSIFLPYSPIHDGAVLIQKGKLTKAGCFLPLTQNPEVSKALGTRHRAAIGLTEMVDAVVIVVSEETGAISVVVGGRITRDLDSATLIKVLKRLLAPTYHRWPS